MPIIILWLEKVREKRGMKRGALQKFMNTLDPVRGTALLLFQVAVPAETNDSVK
jgi:hypothetical protein